MHDPGDRDLGWLEAAAAETAMRRCPVCTASITEADQIGVIEGTQRR
jgi:hypothetical protein